MTKPRPLPVDPGPFTWWVSTDQERWTPGGDTREIAIDEAINQGDYIEIEPEAPGEPWRAGFFVGQYRKRVVDLSLFFDAKNWIERLYDEMDEELGYDEFGENHPLDQITDDENRALESSVRSAIWHWQTRRDLRLSPHWLEEAPGTKDEWVTVPLPED
jgi:hypothetical protein